MNIFVARSGSLISIWFKDRPPEINILAKVRRVPKFKAPDVYHDRIVGMTHDVLMDFVAVGILPEKFTSEPVQSEWAEQGLKLAKESKAKKRVPKPNPEVSGLFAAECVGKVERR